MHFGSVLLRNNVGEVYSLDLYDTRDTHDSDLRAIAGRGYYLPPRRRFERELPIGPAVVEAIAGAESLSIVERAINNGEIETVSDDARNLNGPFTGTLYLELEDALGRISVSVSAPQRRDGRTGWTGSVRGHGAWSDEPRSYDLDFVLEQYGSIEPVLYLVTLLYFMFDKLRDTRARPLTYLECKREAVDFCGPGNVKAFGIFENSSIGVSVGVSAGVTAGASIGTGSGCSFECFEPPKRQTQE